MIFCLLIWGSLADIALIKVFLLISNAALIKSRNSYEFFRGDESAYGLDMSEETEGYYADDRIAWYGYDHGQRSGNMSGNEQDYEYLQWFCLDAG